MALCEVGIRMVSSTPVEQKLNLTGSLLSTIMTAAASVQGEGIQPMLENRQLVALRQTPASRVTAKKLSGAKALTRGLSLLLVLPISLGMLVLAPDNKNIAPAQALVGSDDNPLEIRLAALDCLLKEDLEGAMDSYNTAIESATRHYGQDSLFLAELYYEAGSLALRMDLFDRAESYLNQAIKINPRLSMARLTLAEVSRKRERPMEALEQIQAELSDRPDSIIARQQFIRWLGANAKNPTDHSIANQESLRLLAMTSQIKSNRLKAMQNGRAAALTPRPASANSPVGKPVTSTATGTADNAANKVTNSATYKPGAVKLPTVKVESEPAKPETARSETARSEIAKPGATKPETKSAEKPETSKSTKPGSKSNEPNQDTATKALPTFGFGMSKFVKEKAEKTKKLEAEKLEKEKREKAAQKAAEEAQKAAREKADRERAERERAERERRNKEKKAQKSESSKAESNKAGKKAVETPAAPEPKATTQEPKAAETKKPESKKAEESGKVEEKTPKDKKDKKDKSKAKPVPVEEATPQPQQTQQPQQMMAPMQPVYAPFQVMPIMSSPAPKKGKGGLVPPPPPTMPMYPGMAPPPVPMMIPNQFQQPVERPKPKPKPKPVKVEEAPKEAVEDKPPPMTTGGDSDPDFILDWGDVKKKKK